MKNLVIDIGNSSAKLAIFHYNQIKYLNKVDDINQLNILELAENNQVNNIICSSVSVASLKQVELLEQNFNFLWFNHKTKIPVHNKYQNPEKLGLDRIAGVIGAYTLYPNTDVLVIDAGTCITYDFINLEANFFGGSISPGLDMRFKALAQYTARLPLVSIDKNFISKYGNNTNTSILSGVINGLIGEIKEFITIHNDISKQLKVIICGGNASFFDSKLKNSIFAHQISLEPNLVMLGLNKVLSYHNE